MLSGQDWGAGGMFKSLLNLLSSVLGCHLGAGLPGLLAAPWLSWWWHRWVPWRPPRWPGGGVPGGDRGVHPSLDWGLVRLDREKLPSPGPRRLDQRHVANEGDAPGVGVVNIHWLILGKSFVEKSSLEKIMEFFIIGLTPLTPHPIWPKLWKLLKMLIIVWKIKYNWHECHLEVEP